MTKRYIDANRVSELIESRLDALTLFDNQDKADGYEMAIQHVTRIIAHSDSVDIEGVRHGKWNQQYRSGYEPGKGYVSSCCDMWNDSKSDYCPRCGAKMDENDKVQDTAEYLPEQLTDNWISVKDEMPPEHDSIFAKFYGTKQWNKNMWCKMSDEVIVAIELENGTKKTTTRQTHDGVWKQATQIVKETITHWMPLPEPPKERNSDK